MSEVRSLFVGNLDPNVKLEDLRKLFESKGIVQKIDMKNGFAFVFMESGYSEAIHELDGREFGSQRRMLKVEYARGDGIVKRREEQRRSEAQSLPCDTLFVVNFDPISTTTRDLEKIFQAFGKTIRVDVKKNFAFIQYEAIADATKARDDMNGKQIDGHEITVEYVARDRGRSPPRRSNRRSHSRSRSRSPRRYQNRRDGDRNRDVDKDRGRYRDKEVDRDRDRDRDREVDRNRDRKRDDDRDRDRDRDQPRVDREDWNNDRRYR